MDSTGGMDTGIPLPGTTGEGVDESGSEIFDVGNGGATAGGGDCPGGGGGSANDEYSIIWIANSPEGTVSKIDTRTGQELARYWSGPTEGDDDPSRTSVNLVGDVAVSNRGSGVVKIAGHIDSCVDLDGNGTIETSQGMDDVLPWGTDECVLWYTDFPADGDHRHGPRPTAWDAGSSGNPCTVGDERVWIGWYDAPADTGRFRRLAGQDGAILDEVAIEEWNAATGTQDNYGPYGGAVNAQGDLWVTGLQGTLARIDAETLDTQVWAVPDGSAPYGVTLDSNGHPWTGGWSGIVLHFDPDTEQFDEIDVDGRRMRGLQIDRDGQAWIAANNPCGALQIDTASLSVVADIELPGCSGPVGVSIDVDGNVWLPDREANLAFKLDPSDYSTTTTPGLVGPYTYSDMTGAGLGLVVNPPAG